MQSHRQDQPIRDGKRHDPAENWARPTPPGWFGRSHVAVIARGCQAAQDDHLIGLQSAVGRAVRLLINFEMPRFRLARLARPMTLLRHLF